MSKGAGYLNKRVHLQRRMDVDQAEADWFWDGEGSDLVDDGDALFIEAEPEESGGAADIYGNPVAGPFTTIYTVAAGLKSLRGSEPVIAARLTGVQPYVVTVRQSSQTRQLDASWIIVDARNESRIFNIRAIHDPDQSGKYLEILAEQGVPV